MSVHRIYSWGAFPIVVALLSTGALLVPVDDPATPPGASALSVVGVMRHLEGPAYEPTIGITPAGNIFFAGGVPQNDPAFPGESWIHGSYDNGATWVHTTSAIAANDIEVYDPFLTVDRDTGRIFRLMMHAQSVGGNGCLQLITSDDEGATWREDPDLCVSPPFHDHESLATGKPRGALVPRALDEPAGSSASSRSRAAGYPNLVHLCLNHLQGTECAVSLDGAQSFLPPHPVFASVGAAGWCGGLNSPVQTDSVGRVFVPRIHCEVPSVAASDDGGLTWTIHTLPGPTVPRPPFLGLGEDLGLGLGLGIEEPPYIDLNVMHLAIDAADNLHVVYVAGDGTPYYLNSQDHGVTWSAARQIAVPGITAVATSLITIDAGASGHVAFAYLATDHPGGYATENWEGAEWDMHLGVLTDAFGAGPVQWTQVNPADDPLGVDDCGVDRCQETACPEQYCVGMYDYIGLAIAPDGRPWIAMVDVCHAICAITGEHDITLGAVGTLASGPSLTRPGEALAPLGWSP